MNVAQELGDDELYDYDIFVKLGDRFDPASRVSASRSRFHGWLRRHHEYADSFADAITDLCRVGYPQSSPELRQELSSEQFVRGQSDPELKKYLSVVIRTQKDRKLQTLIEVCTDFASLGTSPNIHRPADTEGMMARWLHRPPKVFGQSCLPVVILHVQCFGIHISSLYRPIILIFPRI